MCFPRPAWRPSLLLAILAAAGESPAPAQAIRSEPRKAAEARRIPEGLNFANGLFRDRRYELAADEYERFLKAAKPGPDAHDARFGLANARLFQGKYPEARRQFEAFLREAPDHPNAAAARYRVGETANMTGDLPAARRALDEYTTRHPGHRHLDTAWPYLGDVCFRLNDLPAARAAYESGLKAFPEGRLADRNRSGLARTLAALGETDAALKVLAALAESGGPEWTARAKLESAKIRAAAGRHAEAIAGFSEVEEAAPRGPLAPEAQLRRAESLIALDRRDEADAVLAPLAADAGGPQAAQASYDLGMSQLDRGRAAESLRTFDDAMARLPGSPLTAALLFGSAEAAAKLGRGDDARARWIRASEADPKDPWADDALVRAAGQALDARDHDEARHLARSFSTRFPDSPLKAEARLIEARAELAAGRPKPAIAILNATLAEDKPTPAAALSARYCLARAYKADGQPAKATEVIEALAKAPSATATDAQYLLGQSHVDAGRFAEAIAPLEGYLTAKPAGEVADYALALLAHAHLETGRADAADADLDALAARFPASKALAPTRLRLAEAALSARQFDRAIPLFRLAGASDDPALVARARSGLGWSLLQSGHPAKAAEAFTASATGRPDDPQAAEATLGLGRALEAAGQVEPALAAYSRAQAMPGPHAGPAALARARLLVLAKKPAEAAEAFGRYLDDNPKAEDASPDDVLAEWGWALVDAGKPAEADRVFGRLLARAPEGPRAADARLNLAESAFEAKDPAKVSELLAPVVAPGSTAKPLLIQSALYRLGRSRAEAKDWDAAATDLDRLAAEYPDGPYRREARFWRAEVAFQAGDPRAAEAGFAALLDGPVAPADPKGLVSSARRRRLQCLVALERWKDALAEAQAWTPEGPDDPQTAEVAYARGRACQGLAQFDEARAAFREVVETRPGTELAAKSQLMIGETYFHQKDYGEAIRELLRVDLTYDAPTWQAASLLELGKVYEQLARWADAAETYERLRSKFPDDPSSAAVLRRLDSVRKRAADRGGDSGSTRNR